MEAYQYIKNFPILYMVSNKFEYKFELNYEDLFYINSEKIYFMVIFEYSNKRFTLGKIFLKKYLFTYSFENSLIGFYINQNIEKNNGSITKIVIIIVLLFILIVFVVFGVWIYKNKIGIERQKRVNEISDDLYDYEEHKKDEGVEEGIN